MYYRYFVFKTALFVLLATSCEKANPKRESVASYFEKNSDKFKAGLAALCAEIAKQNSFNLKPNEALAGAGVTDILVRESEVIFVLEMSLLDCNKEIRYRPTKVVILCDGLKIPKTQGAFKKGKILEANWEYVEFD